MAELVEVAHMQISKITRNRYSLHHPTPFTHYHYPSILSLPNSRTQNSKSWKLVLSLSASSALNQTAVNDDTLLPPQPKTDFLNGNNEELNGDCCSNKNISRNKRVFFLDVNPLCYKGSTPSLHSFAHWISLFFSQVSLNDPVIAVLDGERGNEYRRQLLPSYKANRRKILQQLTPLERSPRSTHTRSHELVMDFLQKCNVPVVKIEGHEADDVVATLVEQVLQKGYRAVIASPDKDFKQLISEAVQIVIPLPDLDRWSFYTLKHYIAQYNCEPQSDLSLRCILGDEVDGIPGIHHLAPGFGRKTALKLLKKHGSLENLLSAATVRTVGKQYAQEALTKYADFLRTNYKVLALRRDLDVHLEEQWLCGRDAQNDSEVLSSFMDFLGKTRDHKWQNRSHSIVIV
ncbi:hypothetical protein ACJIZ3_019074 [Penstemon smallii]|uniref:5'-3' exonuclease domain-containing protein n=1 Tax=Penstemon smallii TaxID=265156 RepID=A0ABD3T1M6_9LAMI